MKHTRIILSIRLLTCLMLFLAAISSITGEKLRRGGGFSFSHPNGQTINNPVNNIKRSTFKGNHKYYFNTKNKEIMLKCFSSDTYFMNQD